MSDQGNTEDSVFTYGSVIGPVYDELEGLKQYNPPALQLRENLRYTPEDPLSPLTFYDKHLDKDLSLKRVRLLPSLLTDLARNFDQTLKALDEGGIRLPPHRVADDFPAQYVRKRTDGEANIWVSHPISVAFAYKDMTGRYCSIIASMLVLHPYIPRWIPIASWVCDDEETPTEGFYANEDGSLRIISRIFREDESSSPRDTEVLSYLSDETRTLAKDLLRCFPDMGTWVMTPFTPEAEELIMGIDALDTYATFPAETSLTINFDTRDPLHGRPIKPDDAAKPHWEIPDTTNSSDLDPNPQLLDLGTRVVGNDALEPRPTRKSARLKGTVLQEGKSQPHQRREESQKRKVQKTLAGTEMGASDKSRGEILTSPQHCRGTKRKREDDIPTPNRLVQHAWAQSVRKDTTIIVFHSGNFERIGIRDRRNQTLWVSDLIDVPNTHNPAYGHLHTGLHIAALRDAIDRLKQQRDTKEVDARPRRRRRTDTGHARKRLTRFTIKERENFLNKEKRIFADASHRHVVVMYLQYGSYNSTIPASLFRCSPSIVPGIKVPSPPKSKRKYKPTQYMTLVLTSEIGRGATGVVHGAVLELQMPDGTLLTHDVVVKLSFTEDNQARLREEYLAYCSLSAAGVTGIPTVLGLFEHHDEGIMALIMNYAGVSLRKSNGVSITPADRTKFATALKSIHTAGFRHNDLRPHNLLVNEFGEVAIIDFDRATKETDRARLSTEWYHLRDVLNGKNVRDEY